MHQLQWHENELEFFMQLFRPLKQKIQIPINMQLREIELAITSKLTRYS